jgi:ATP-binding cassette subfamily B protein
VVTEMRVHHTLEAEQGRRTRLVITHRASIAARADTVIWLEAGRVRAVGPHRALWHDPAYREVFG